jgi:hypothetical protein
MKLGGMIDICFSSSWSKQWHNSRMEKKVMSEIKLYIPFMVPGFVYKLQMIYLSKTKIIEQKPNVEWTVMSKI